MMSALISRNPGFDQLIGNLLNMLSDEKTNTGFDVPFEIVKNKANDIVSEMHATYVAKDSDYAADGKPMGNLRVSEKMGIAAWRAVVLRMNDKRSRIASFISKGSYAVEDEKITDTLIDLAVYSLLGSVLHDEVYTNKHTQKHFLNIAFQAIRCKMLYDFEKSYPQTKKWSDDSWRNLEQDFDWLVRYSYDNSELAKQ